MEFCVLGPLEARVDGALVGLGGARQRALLAVLLLHEGEVISADRLIDELWGEEPPPTAAHTVQVFISRLRKAIGPQAAECLLTRAPGYLVRLQPDELDLHRFERLVEEGHSALAAGEASTAAALLRDALSLWRGPALADLAYEPFAQAAVARLDELRLSALADRIDADLALGRHEAIVGELEGLVAEHPLRERFRGQLMISLYRSGRQADALEVYQDTRRALVEELGIDPGRDLQRLERAILMHDSELEPPPPRAPGPSGGAGRQEAARTILVVPAPGEPADALVALAELLAGSGTPHEILVCRLVPPARAAELGAASAELERVRAALVGKGIAARSAVFTSPSTGADIVRLAADEKVDLLLTDCPPSLAAGGQLVTVLAEAPCDVCLVVRRAQMGNPGPERPVLVPFGGGANDWAALELGAWLAGAAGSPLRLLGTIADGAGERDASRLLAVATLAVQRLVGIAVEPRLAPAGSSSVIDEAGEAALVALGLPERWRQEGLGTARLAVASGAAPPVLLVRRGLRPSGLAPPESMTRFTWSLAGAGRDA